MPNLFTMATLHQIVRVVLVASYGAQQIRNVFTQIIGNPPTNWDSAAGLESLENLARHLAQNAIEEFLGPMTSNGVGFTRVDAQAHTGAGPYWTAGPQSSWTIGENGAIGGDGMPTYDAWPLVLNPASVSLVRRGYKRFVGLPEAQQNFGVIANTGTWFADANDLAEYMETVHDVTVPDAPNLDMAYAIPKTEKVVVDGKDTWPIIGAYRIAEAIPRLLVTTQNSRKRGRGI